MPSLRSGGRQTSSGCNSWRRNYEVMIEGRSSKGRCSKCTRCERSNECAAKDSACGLKQAHSNNTRSATNLKESASSLKQANSNNARRCLTVLQMRRMCR